MRIFGVFLIVGAAFTFLHTIPALNEWAITSQEYADLYANGGPLGRWAEHYVTSQVQFLQALLAWLMLGLGVAIIWNGQSKKDASP